MKSSLVSLVLLVGATVLAQSNPVPLINQPLVPAIAAPGARGFTLTVNGTGFVSTSTVKWNGSALVTNFVNASQLSAKVPASDLAKAGTASVSVATGSETSNLAFFEVTTPRPTVSFVSTQYSPGTQGFAAATGDFNGDGKLDIAVTNSALSTVNILLGNGDGSFQSPVSYAITGKGSAIATGDFNGDGKLDLATANGKEPAGNTISILLGNGDGTFQPHADVKVGVNPTAVVAGDFNADGKLDLAVADTGHFAITLLLGNGDGTFHLSSFRTAFYPTSLAVGDFNGDGKLDLVLTSSFDDIVEIFLGNGDGSFTMESAYSFVGQRPLSLVTADLNGDGKLDVAVANGDGTVSVLLGNGDATFQSGVTFPIGAGAVWVAVGDLNGDGKLDLMTANKGAATTSLLLGNGDGSFQAKVDYPMSRPRSLALGDFNNDGRMDLAVGGGTLVTTLVQD